MVYDTSAVYRRASCFVMESMLNVEWASVRARWAAAYAFSRSEAREIIASTMLMGSESARYPTPYCLISSVHPPILLATIGNPQDK